jgi:tyrosine-protein phosphatase YwqE
MPVTEKAQCGSRRVHTETVFEEHALKENVLSIGTFVSNANLLIQGSEARLD